MAQISDYPGLLSVRQWRGCGCELDPHTRQTLTFCESHDREAQQTAALVQIAERLGTLEGLLARVVARLELDEQPS